MRSRESSVAKGAVVASLASVPTEEEPDSPSVSADFGAQARSRAKMARTRGVCIASA